MPRNEPLTRCLRLRARRVPDWPRACLHAAAPGSASLHDSAKTMRNSASATCPNLLHSCQARWGIDGANGTMSMPTGERDAATFTAEDQLRTIAQFQPAARQTLRETSAAVLGVTKTDSAATLMMTLKGLTSPSRSTICAAILEWIASNPVDTADSHDLLCDDRDLLCRAPQSRWQTGREMKFRQTVQDEQGPPRRRRRPSEGPRRRRLRLKLRLVKEWRLTLHCSGNDRRRTEEVERQSQSGFRRKWHSKRARQPLRNNACCGGRPAIDAYATASGSKSPEYDKPSTSRTDRERSSLCESHQHRNHLPVVSSSPYLHFRSGRSSSRLLAPPAVNSSSQLRLGRKLVIELQGNRG